MSEQLKVYYFIENDKRKRLVKLKSPKSCLGDFKKALGLSSEYRYNFEIIDGDE